jgi:hypothetical protein
MPKRPIDESSSQWLQWTQPRAGRRAFDLRLATQIVAALRWRSDAVAETTGAPGTARLYASRESVPSTALHLPDPPLPHFGRWRFTRTGFWYPRVVVRRVGSGRVAAVFTARWTGVGTLELPAGDRVHWSAAHTWQAGDGTPLIQVMSRHRQSRLEGTVEIAPTATDAPILGLLVLLGWYLVVLQAQDAGMVATPLQPAPV